ncbi:MAG: hypothetical protein AMXMBFR13_23470 [Phycisphaerae bacterium]
MFLPAVRAAESAFLHDPAAGLEQWTKYLAPGAWKAQDGSLISTEPKATTARLAKIAPVADVLIETEVRTSGPGRRCFGLVFRAQEGNTCQVARFYDGHDKLELLGYIDGQVKRQVSGTSSLQVLPQTWYHFKAAAVEDQIMAKLWPADDAAEPDWQLRVNCPQRAPGGAGLLVDDGSQVEFKNVRIAWNDEVAAIRQTLAAEREARLQRIEAGLKIDLEPTPFVLRSDEGPQRRVLVNTRVENQLEPVDGRIEADYGGKTWALDVKAADAVEGSYEMLVPEPSEKTVLRITFSTDSGKRLFAAVMVQPVRQWTIHMAPHVHYDIGFTEPQPEVMDRLVKDMDSAVEYVERTADWPEDSRYRWNIEVSNLFKLYAERRSPEQVERLIKHVKDGRIEICGFYLNMPAEVMGHEETIRCLYYAQELRNRYGITIDTAMINDVPGYGWCFPELFDEAGIHRVSFRANGIRGQFLWYRQGGVPRPFYWQGPEGSKLFMWYTDTYRDGNFFRSPGLHERDFYREIKRNEAAGYKFDSFQLRMGGDNLPPDFNTSVNARAFAAKYLWPKVKVSTNREFLEPLEKAYGDQCPTFSGDIPSWWAEGPASSAHENGLIRLAHDRLVAAEALWTLGWLADPKLEYPRQRINEAYDKMIHFDEHTWGASTSITAPKSENTLGQWKWKTQYAYDTKRMTDELHSEILDRLSAQVAWPCDLVVWNTLTWARSGVVELPLSGTPFEQAKSIQVFAVQPGESVLKPVPTQLSADTRTAYFVARDVPALSYARFTVNHGAQQPALNLESGDIIENGHYRITAAPEVGGLASWYDKALQRELFDAQADYRGNQPIHERSLDGREGIRRKVPTRFERVTPKGGKVVRRTAGPVFSELVLETSLPGVPTIRQHIRLYNDFKMVDIRNEVTKEEVFEPEGVYFAFPFDVSPPGIRFEIANATMRPGKDQLPYSCQDFYAIQHWANLSGDGYGVIWAPLEAGLVTVSGLNAYQWADQIDFNNAHLYSWVMNNYWDVNFRAAQPGTTSFSYRLTSYEGKQDPTTVTRFAWSPFYPLTAVWMKAKANGALSRAPGESAASAEDSASSSEPTPAGSLLKVEGDRVVVSCIKRGEWQDAVIVRLLEMNGQPAECTLHWSLPAGRQIAKAFLANALEQPGEPLTVEGHKVAVKLRAHEIVTVGIVPR